MPLGVLEATFVTLSGLAGSALARIGSNRLPLNLEGMQEKIGVSYWIDLRFLIIRLTCPFEVDVFTGSLGSHLG